uniref:Uncharacterized protein n=1 Tax=Arundo donax TaxID=35708 RepID=A0A0A9HQG7_ARUDO
MRIVSFNVSTSFLFIYEISVSWMLPYKCLFVSYYIFFSISFWGSICI